MSRMCTPMYLKLETVLISVCLMYRGGRVWQLKILTLTLTNMCCRAVEVLLWAWFILDFGSCSVQLPEITDAKFISECVREHNKARSSVSPPASNMLYMTWDEALAITARAWARHCEFNHNPLLRDVRRMHPTFSSVGENVWTGLPPLIFSPTAAIEKWVSEKSQYNFEINTCSQKPCGHYTQVVWDSTFKVGCAAQLCPDGVKNFDPREGVVFVCNYATAGNFNGKKPYESKGDSCSECKDSCVDNLCHNKERESQKSYNWSPDWDPVTTSSSSNYMTVLIVRPTALLFTFLTAYAIRFFFPDVFCYE